VYIYLDYSRNATYFFCGLVFLNLITKPYVIVLSQCDKEKTLLRARRLNLLGNPVDTCFDLKDAVKVGGTVHPFASFKVQDDYYYVFGKTLRSNDIRLKLTHD